MRSVHNFIGAVLVPGAMGLFAPGCATPIGTYCDEVCACTHCPRSERRECADVAELAEKDASDKNCSEAFDAYIQCAGTSVECSEDAAAVSGCEAEEDALYECAGDVGIGKSACDAA